LHFTKLLGSLTDTLMMVCQLHSSFELKDIKMIVVSELREVYIEVILTIPKYSIKIHLQK